ncbi:HNH endonuclease [Pendulispora rubella]
MSDDEACRRVAASRIARRFPLALNMLERGDLHLTALLLLRDYLTQDNHEELLRAAAGKTKGQVQELLATYFPRPDVPSLMGRLPDAAAQPATGTSGRAAKTTRVEPLSPERYKVQFTASSELKAKLEYALDLMRHANPDGDLSIVVERALDLLVVELEKRRLGKTSRPATKAPRNETRSGYVTRATRREVFERDGGQCTFVDESGRRCECRSFLELDHIAARARGGTDEATNLQVRCRSHNRLAAERDFGRAYIDEKRSGRRPSHLKTQCAPNLPIHPRQRGYESATALRALTYLGFKESQARHALNVVEERMAGSAPCLESVVHATLSLLT